MLERAVKLSPVKIDQLRTDLEQFAIRELQQLKAELTTAEPADGRGRSLKNLWDQTVDHYAAGVAAFRGHLNAAIEYDALIRHTTDLSKWREDGEETAEGVLGRAPSRSAAGYQLVRVPNSDHASGVILSERRANDAATVPPRTIRMIGVQMRRDWTCHVRGDAWLSFADLLSELSTVRHLVLIVLPWTPYHPELPSDARTALEGRQSRGQTTSIVTPAAFCVMMSALLRNFTDGAPLMTLLAEAHTAPFHFVALSTVQERLKTAGVAWPESLREAILSHFEVDPVEVVTTT